MNGLLSGASPVLLLDYWKPVLGFEGFYEVSVTGRVRRLSSGIILKMKPNKLGRFHLTLSKHGADKKILVHRMVATSFIGVCPVGLQVNHIDGDKSNNRLSNLEYVTNYENYLHAKRHGLHKLKPITKIPETTAKEIISLKGKLPSHKIATRFKVSRGAIRNIWRRASI